MKRAVVLILSAVAISVNAATLIPKPVVKPVKIVRRPIKVAIVAEEMPRHPGPDCKDDVQAMIDFWTAEMDREAVNRPDLIALPEIADCWERSGCVNAQFMSGFYARRGDRVLKAFAAYAKKHRCYLVYGTMRNREDGKWANSSIMIDRDGDVVAVYDKAFPVVDEIVNDVRPVVPGKPVVVDTDFGRVGFMICFDLNFLELADAYEKLAPDVMVYSSHFDGDFRRREWANRIGAWVVASANERLPKTICDPCGGEYLREHAYFRTITGEINTNYGVFHIDYNKPKYEAALRKYAPRLKIRNPGQVGTILLTSDDPALKVSDVAKEFDLEYVKDYFARARKTRFDAVGPLK